MNIVMNVVMFFWLVPVVFAQTNANMSALLNDASSGQVEAEYKMGLVYEKGTNGVPRNHDEMMKWYKSAAEKGYAVAQYALGEHYLICRCETNWCELSPAWLAKAADQGYTEAQFKLGYCYYFGTFEGGIKINQAVELFKKACNSTQSCQAAKCAGYMLGSFYDRGEQGLPVDRAEASKWWLKAAELGNEQAQVKISLRYLEGIGVPKSYVEAERWYLKAASSKLPEYVEGLGYLYYANAFGRDSAREALPWLQKAADLKQAFAQHILASMYENGAGTNRNLIEAYAWYNVAYANGWNDSSFARERILSQLTSSQQATAQSRSMELWKHQESVSRNCVYDYKTSGLVPIPPTSRQQDTVDYVKGLLLTPLRGKTQ